MIDKLLLRKPYFPDPNANRMNHVGDVVRARENYLKYRPSNLTYLLRKRFEWMNDFIRPGESGIEVGCGTGLSKLFIVAPDFILTDYADHPWVEVKVDALNMPYADASLDYIVSSNMIHHLATPAQFFKECQRVLKPGGRIIIQEINTSLAMRAILRAMRHEGYSFEPDVFSFDVICNDPRDLWSANCAIPRILFDDQARFEREQTAFKITHKKFTEFMLFPLSGGVIAKTKTINLPKVFLGLVNALDGLLCAIAPQHFALQRQIVLEKR
ncbi:methyltransferase type 11 [Nibricoccus aquaticus]|uniref:Methyltransferase type 11 n=1 Tax=Nibricoccus aquaticus TaxID=2576891 RepID=A0A290Q8G4_9BACT|nr:class I SAM-dependent methyltransferase [Nibricoccus aquaticus]ATC64733.1 methyltransferase type 11 [Nibricoccus aquaticus]